MRKINRIIWMICRRVTATFAFAVIFLPLLECFEPSEDMKSKRTENLQICLSSMPNEDKQDLESLFRCLMADGDFAYSLFGDKPIAMADFIVDVDFEFFHNHSTFNYAATVYKGWLVWQKYKSSFSSNSFIFTDYVSSDFKLIGFVLYNKDRVRSIYDKHQALMNEVFGDLDSIVTSISCPTAERFKLSGDHPLYHQAVGLLLGYDETNAKRFREKLELIDALTIGLFTLEGLNSKNTQCFLSNLQHNQPIHSKHPERIELRQSDIIRRVNDLSENLKPISLSQRDLALSPIRAPKYMALSIDQGIVKKQKVNDTIRNRLREIYFSDSFLEIVLSKLQT